MGHILFCRGIHPIHSGTPCLGALPVDDLLASVWGHRRGYRLVHGGGILLHLVEG